MKVAIGYRVQEGPWGGGNRFVAALIEALGARGHEVVHDLSGDDVDAVLIIDPRARNPATAFTPGQIVRYLLWRNPNAVVVHRVNECDERKKTRTMNLRLRLANACADHTVFVGSWLRDLPTWRAKERAPTSVILNGADTAIFNAGGHRLWDGAGPLRLVTHHWGGNWMKGFDVYQRLDRMLAEPAWRGRIDFTYIGNLPTGFSFENAAHVAPLTGDALADELRRHHVYLTASINEPGGHHQNEGALCGLPLIYRDSGCLPEYCDGFGVMFEPDGFGAALERMIAEYDRWAAAMPSYPHTAERATEAYIELFGELIARRDEIVAARRLGARPVANLLNQVAW